ncbi:MAG: acyltransferase [Actinomycetota bacterium]|nr:acyltransferase [Actinomycetota bacterium]
MSTKVGDRCSEPGSFRLGHRPALDGVRGIAVLLILALHATYLLVPRLAGQYVPGAFIGVDIFFVLSGFLITSLLLEEWDRNRRLAMRRFYRRRARRLFPALWVVMTVQLIYTLIAHDPLRSELKGLAAMFSYVGNFSWRFGAVVPSAFGQTWSLAVEEQFYLLWPLVLIVLIRLRSRQLVTAVMCTLIAAAFVCRAVLFNVGVPWVEVYVQTEARFDALIMGALLAHLLHSGWRPPRWIGIYGALGTGFLAVVVVSAHGPDGWLFDGGYDLVAFASAIIIATVLDSRSVMARVLAIGPLRFIGRLSYSLYLWHVFVFLVVERAWPTRSSLLRLVAGASITGLAAVLSYSLIERPFLRRKAVVSARDAGTAVIV